jgi:hypothetical protein
MNPPIRKFFPALAMATVAGMATSPCFGAQAHPADLEAKVSYAQCIRANGYGEFPDPTGDGRLMLRLDAKDAPRFEAAQQACKDKLPPGLRAVDEGMTPERMQALLGFARCVRNKGVKDFPDPSAAGVFEPGNAVDMTAPRTQQALEACRESNPPGALQIRRTR